MNFKRILAAVFAVSCFVLSVEAQQKQKNIVKVDMVMGPLGFYGFSYERILAEQMTAQVYVDIISSTYNLSDFTLGYSGFSVMPEFRYYFSNKGAPQGFFLGAYLPYRSLTLNVTATGDVETPSGTLKGKGVTNSTFSFVGIGLVMGPQWVIGKRVTLDFYTGFAVGALNLSNPTIELKTEDATGNTFTGYKDLSLPLPLGIMPRIGLTLGVVF